MPSIILKGYAMKNNATIINLGNLDLFTGAGALRENSLITLFRLAKEVIAVGNSPLFLVGEKMSFIGMGNAVAVGTFDASGEGLTEMIQKLNAATVPFYKFDH
jgi:hypothetical protein